MLGRDVTRSFTESSAESTTGDRFNSVRRISRLIGGNFTGIYNVSCWWASADTRPTRFVAFQSIRGGGSGMQINGGGKHHALTKFYLDKSVDTRHRDEAVIYIYIYIGTEYGNQLTKITRNVLWMHGQRWIGKLVLFDYLCFITSVCQVNSIVSIEVLGWISLEILEICDIT